MDIVWHFFAFLGQILNKLGSFSQLFSSGIPWISDLQDYGRFSLARRIGWLATGIVAMAICPWRWPSPVLRPKGYVHGNLPTKSYGLIWYSNDLYLRS
jgi:hypothetical protein